MRSAISGSPNSPKTTTKVDYSAASNVTNNDSSVNGSLGASNVGGVIPSVIGTKLVSELNLIWTGGLTPLISRVTTPTIETEIELGEDGDGNPLTTTTTIQRFVTSIVTRGYVAACLFGICLGPGVKLKAILNNGSAIWFGSAGPAMTPITTSNGWNGIFLGGDYDQPAMLLAPDFPAMPGIALLYLNGIDVTKNIGQLSVLVERIPNPLGLDADVNTSPSGVNPISVMAEFMINSWGYGSLALSDLDIPTLTSMAERLKLEGNWATAKLTSESTSISLVAELQAQADAFIYQDPQTGKITGRLLRTADLDLSANAKRFGPANIKELRNFAKSSWEDVPAAFTGSVVNFDNRADNTITAKNVLVPDGAGTARKIYPFVQSTLLGTKLIARDLAKIAAPTFSFDIVGHREHTELVPGDYVSVFWPNYGLSTIALVYSINDHPLEINDVTIKLGQAIFPNVTPVFNQSGFVVPAPISPPNSGVIIDPTPPTHVAAVQAPYRFTRSRWGVDAIQAVGVYPMFFAGPTTTTDVGYTVTYGDGDESAASQFATSGQLISALSQYEGWETGVIPNLTVNGFSGDYLPKNEDGDIEGDIDTVREGTRFMHLISAGIHEILSFESATDNEDGTWTLHNVYRGLVDTVAHYFAAGTSFYITTNLANNVGKIIGTWQTYGNYEFRFRSMNLLGGYGSLSVVTAMGVPMAGGSRGLKPLRPHDIRINGERGNASTRVELTVGDEVTITWKIRNRISTNVPIASDASEIPEAGQKHYISFITNIVTGAGIQLVDLMSGDTATFTVPTELEGYTDGFIKVSSMIDRKLNSYDMPTAFHEGQTEYIPVTIVP